MQKQSINDNLLPLAESRSLKSISKKCELEMEGRSDLFQLVVHVGGEYRHKHKLQSFSDDA